MIKSMRILAGSAFYLLIQSGCAPRPALSPQPLWSSQTSNYVKKTYPTHYPVSVMAQSLPPAPLQEHMGSLPAQGYIWVDGFWHWDGGDWVWVEGQWMPPRGELVYVQPSYDISNNNCYYTPGYWSDPSLIVNNYTYVNVDIYRPPTVVIRRPRRPMDDDYGVRQPKPPTNHRPKPGPHFPPPKVARPSSPGPVVSHPPGTFSGPTTNPGTSFPHPVAVGPRPIKKPTPTQAPPPPTLRPTIPSEKPPQIVRGAPPFGGHPSSATPTSKPPRSQLPGIALPGRRQFVRSAPRKPAVFRPNPPARVQQQPAFRPTQPVRVQQQPTFRPTPPKKNVVFFTESITLAPTTLTTPANKRDR